ncbi:MAG: hypothetical protein AAFV59_06115 [Pseudomonadota bacterium]
MGNGNKVEFLVAICALIASAMAVFMAWDQGRVMRAQQHGAVFPVLQVDGYVSSRGDTTAVGIEIRNSGVGPALIESAEFFVGDDSTEPFHSEVMSLPDGFELSWTAIVGRALAPGDTVNPIDMVWPEGVLGTEDRQNISEGSQEWRLEICYCSVFDRCWKTQKIGRSRAIPVEACERQETDIFEQFGLEYLASDQESLPVQEASE